MPLIQSVTDWFTEAVLSRARPEILELGSRHFRRLRGFFRDGGFVVEESAAVDSPPRFVLSPHLGVSIFDLQAFEDAVRGLFGSKSPRNRPIAVVIPDQAFHLGLVSIPAVLLQSSIQPVIEREVQSGSPRPLAEYRTAWEVGTGKGPKRSLLFSCLTHGSIDEYCSAFERLGLIPLSINPSFSHLAHLMKLIEPEPGSSPSVLIHLGHEATTVMIVLGGFIRRLQVIPVGSGDFSKALAAAGAVTLTEAERQKREGLILLEDPTADAQGEIPAYATLTPLFTDLLYKIYNVLQLHTVEIPQENSFRRIVLSGGGSALRHFDRLIAANLGLAVDHLGRLLKPLISPLPGKSLPEAFLGDDSLSTLAPLLGALYLQPWKSDRADRMVA